MKKYPNPKVPNSLESGDMYPKVKVRHDDDAELGLKAFVSLYLHPSSPVTDNKVVSMPTVVKVPECYVPHVAIPRPRVHVTEDSEDFSLASDSSVTTGSEKDDSIDGSKVNIRASPIPPPRAVISSPDNDIMIGNRNKTRDGRLSASKNGAMLQNRHAHCKVKSHDVTDIPPETRKHSEPGSKEEIDSVGKRKTHKGRIKFEKVKQGGSTFSTHQCTIYLIRLPLNPRAWIPTLKLFHLFTKEIMRAQLPDSLLCPNVEKFDGTIEPSVHVKAYFT
ncbi:hypothetical protein VNO80_15732 [Phaseolus coccineus]|uniref:Uncharacterized protein n=1 Tax=Phaseolus coccineus TaxID=3886 RepID=A0AAN9MKD5_PHACN